VGDEVALLEIGLRPGELPDLVALDGVVGARVEPAVPGGEELEAPVLGIAEAVLHDGPDVFAVTRPNLAGYLDEGDVRGERDIHDAVVIGDIADGAVLARFPEAFPGAGGTRFGAPQD